MNRSCTTRVLGLLGASGLMLCALPRESLAQPAPPPGWALVWNDEFDGTALDTAKWRAENAALIKNNEQQYYSPANVSVGNGLMTILAERRVQGGRQYCSGLIESRNRFFQAFGRFEVRAKLPRTRGLWPAIWMLNQAGGWPPEIDIMELLGHQPNTVHMTHHWGVWPAVQSQTNSFTGPDFTADFHTFTADWYPDRIEFYVDGVLRATNTSNIPRDPMYLIINTAVGGDWPGMPDQTTILPQLMLVEYARVYRRHLVNESFEDRGTNNSQPLTGWTTSGNCFNEPNSPRTGTRIGKMFGNFTGSLNTSTMYQDVAVVPGQTWRATSWWRNWSPDRMAGANRGVFRLEWRDASGAIIDTVEQTALDAASPVNTHLPVLLEGVAPAGATTLRVVLRFVQPALAAGAAFVDDVALELVAPPPPPPACLADFNTDGTVDPDDLADFIACYFSAPPCPLADVSGDGAADPDDLSDFIALFFTPCP